MTDDAILRRRETNRRWRAENHEHALQKQAEWRAANRERLREQERERYWANREHALALRREYRIANREKFLEAAAARRHQVLEHYGTACACCGTPDQLTIDHINGDGRQHRKELKGSGSVLYRWLVKNNFPPGFQTLCRPCNRSKGDGPRCRLTHSAEVAP